MSPRIDRRWRDRLHDVAGAGLALGADHGRPLGDAAQGLAQVGGAADEGHGERPLVDVVGLVGGGEHLALVDEVDPQRLQHLGLGEVPDAGLGHHRDGDRGLDRLDHGRVAHAGHPAVAPDVGRDPLEGHDRHRAGVLRHHGLVGVDDVHDHAALEHLGQAPLDQVAARRRPGGLRVRHAGHSTVPAGPVRRIACLASRTAGPTGRRSLRGPACCWPPAPAGSRCGRWRRPRPARRPSAPAGTPWGRRWRRRRR